MSEIESIISAVCGALNEKTGVKIVRKFPAGAKRRYEVPVISVGLRSGSGVSAGFAEYLGERYDEESAAYVETYGRKMELTLSVDVYSPNNGECGADKCVETAAAVMSAAQDMHFIRVKKVSCGETGFDSATGMFLCPVEVECACVFYADKFDDERFGAFRLRGEIK